MPRDDCSFFIFKENDKYFTLQCSKAAKKPAVAHGAPIKYVSD